MYNHKSSRFARNCIDFCKRHVKLAFVIFAGVFASQLVMLKPVIVSHRQGMLYIVNYLLFMAKHFQNAIQLA